MTVTVAIGPRQAVDNAAMTAILAPPRGGPCGRDGRGAAMSGQDNPLAGVTFIERGWLSSNNVLLHGRGDGEPTTLVDASHCLHAAQTVALVRHALRLGETLAQVVNTHLHSDHCGGNALLKRAFGLRVVIPAGVADAATRGTRTRCRTARRASAWSASCTTRASPRRVAPGRRTHLDRVRRARS